MGQNIKLLTQYVFLPTFNLANTHVLLICGIYFMGPLLERPRMGPFQSLPNPRILSSVGIGRPLRPDSCSTFISWDNILLYITFYPDSCSIFISCDNILLDMTFYPDSCSIFISWDNILLYITFWSDSCSTFISRDNILLDLTASISIHANLCYHK